VGAAEVAAKSPLAASPCHPALVQLRQGEEPPPHACLLTTSGLRGAVVVVGRGRRGGSRGGRGEVATAAEGRESGSGGAVAGSERSGRLGRGRG